jgi:hypothetical protein
MFNSSCSKGRGVLHVKRSPTTDCMVIWLVRCSDAGRWFSMCTKNCTTRQGRATSKWQSKPDFQLCYFTLNLDENCNSIMNSSSEHKNIQHFVYSTRLPKGNSVTHMHHTSITTTIVQSWDSAVGIAAGWGLDCQAVGVRVPERARFFSSPNHSDRF